jgi:hypothetical protein
MFDLEIMSSLMAVGRVGAPTSPQVGDNRCQPDCSSPRQRHLVASPF